MISHPFSRYALMIFVVVVATLIRIMLVPYEISPPFIPYYPGLILVSLLAGIGPAAAFIVITALIGNFFFLPPYWEFSTTRSALVISSGYVIASSIMVAVIGYYRHKVERQAAQLQKELARRAEAEKAAEDHEKRLATKDEWLRLAIDGASGAGWEARFDPAQPHRFLDPLQLSERHKRFIGFEDEAFPNSLSAWMERVNPEDKPVIAERLEAHIAGRSANYRVEYRIRHRDGSWRWIASNARVFRDAAGRPERCAGIDWDITERKLAEEKLKRISVMLSESQRIAHLGSFEYDVRTRTILWSDEEYRIYGLDPSGPSPTYDTMLARCIHPDDAHLLHEAFTRAIETRAPYELEHRIIRPDGSVRWVCDVAHPYCDANGDLLRYIGTTLDITERKEMEDVLHRAKNVAEDAARSKATFLANMSHEIRTPLHVIIGLAHRLVRNERAPGQLHRLEQLLESSEHLLEIINDILDFSKVDAGRLLLNNAPLRLEEVVAKVRRMLEMRAREKGLQLTTHVAAAVQRAEVLGDSQRLTQVLLNLGSNAVKFTEHGEVDLSIECQHEDSKQIHLKVTVKDTGSGIRPEDQQLIFKPFEQTDASITRAHGGTGLGLAISQGLVNLMGSSIQVQSEPGKGSVFSFDLTLQRVAGTPRSECDSDSVPEHFSGVSVLIAEDHPTSQEILLEMLDELGCEVDVASNGVEAVDLAKKRRYDLVLMDMQMPRMDGLSATRAIRALAGFGETPVIALTANAFAEDRQRCLEAGMSDYLSKPVSPKTLAATLARWLPGFVANVDEQVFESQLSRALQAIDGVDIQPLWLKSERAVNECLTRLQNFAASEGEGLRETFGAPNGVDRERAAFQAHQLKGIAAFLGVRSVQRLAGQLDEALRSSADLPAIREIYRQCENELARLRGILQTIHPATDA